MRPRRHYVLTGLHSLNCSLDVESEFLFYSNSCLRMKVNSIEIRIHPVHDHFSDLFRIVYWLPKIDRIELIEAKTGAELFMQLKQRNVFFNAVRFALNEVQD